MTTHEFDATARWIGRDNPVPRPSPGGQPPAPLLRRDFRLADRPERAELHIAGLGYSVAEINGRAVSDALLDPPSSHYDRTAYSRTIDVTELLHEGENTLGVVLGRSYVSGVGGPDAVWACEPRLLAQLDIVLSGRSCGLADRGTPHHETTTPWTSTARPAHRRRLPKRSAARTGQHAVHRGLSCVEAQRYLTPTEDSTCPLSSGQPIQRTRRR
ncbi:alpha-L-rhamnosidase N-terminal domain-containing protein [Streptomyces sp. NPDC020794]|uniref:alpha-L-rhamnosidase N-terminal domain-containing protein n=1 Tax=unclassified Streptomyces TaxID=2593676 RepID=UPI0036EA97AF